MLSLIVYYFRLWIKCLLLLVMSAAVAACGVGITGSPLRTVVGAEEIRSKRENIYIYI